MVDQYYVVVGVVVLCYFQVYFGDQWVGCVEYFQVVMVCFQVYGLGYFVGIEDYCIVVWYFVEFFDEDGVVVFEVVDYEMVVYDFMVYVDWCFQGFDCVFDDFDCMIDIGIEFMWIGK